MLGWSRKLNGWAPNRLSSPPPRRLMAQWIRDAWESSPNEKILQATRAAYFPNGMKLDALDTAYFAEQQVYESPSDSSEASTSCSSHSSVSDSDSDDDDDSDGDALSVPTSSDCDSQSENGDDEHEVEVVWAKAARGVLNLTWGFKNWGQCHVFDGKLYFTHDINKDDQIPEQLKVPVKSKPAKPAANGASVTVWWCTPPPPPGNRHDIGGRLQGGG